MPEAAICPYCGVTLEKRPQRKEKCPSCGNYIHVKKAPDEEENRVVTEAVAAIEAAWVRHQSRKYLPSDCQSVGISREEYIQEWDKLERQLKRKVTEQDVAWSLLNRTVASTSDCHKLKMAYYGMALRAHNEGKEFIPLLKQARQAELLQYEYPGWHVTIIANQGCEACRRQDGHVYLVEDAQVLMPLPCPECITYAEEKQPLGFCRCMYGGAHPAIVEKPPPIKDVQGHLAKTKQLILADDKIAARYELYRLIRQDAANEVAWLWMSEIVVDEVTERNCLRRVLEINPRNELAQKHLAAPES